ncbi:MAG: polymerase subunit alpha [Moraxellaceae bacterium]|jgi:error-prone DNA polymerase|nr:polymerase subunit alpha [Moraxellaceae bacterium]
MYAELVCSTNFTFLTGASHPEELVARARELGYAALAITDECSLAGVVKAYAEHKDHPGELKLIIGARFRLESCGESGNDGDGDGQDTGAENGGSTGTGNSSNGNGNGNGNGNHVAAAPPDEQLSLVLLVTDRAAYAELSGLITLGRMRCEKGAYRLSLADVLARIHRCLAILVPAEITPMVEAGARALREAFAGRLWLGLNLSQQDDDYARFRRYEACAARLGLPLVAHGDVLMHARERKPLLDVVTAIRLGTTVQALGQAAARNAERRLRPLSALARIYPPELLAETLKIAARCTFSLGELKYEYPDEIIPADWRARRQRATGNATVAVSGPDAISASEASAYLADLTWAGARRRWPQGIDEKLLHQIRAELTLIKELRYEHFFLTVYDIVVFARARGILCQGRGSAANSAVCFCLGITEVDPAKSQLLFERFLSKERNEPPDIDVDFEHERREEVIQYLYGKYGRERAALAATVITYRTRSALRDVGKALGLDAALLDHLAKSMAWWDTPAELVQRLEEAGIDGASRMAQHLIDRLLEIRRFPRHLSQHVGGFVIARERVSDLVPVENAAMPERSVIQWDKDDLESLGLLKVDVLALGMLTAIRKTFQLLERHEGLSLTMAAVPAEDEKTYDMLCRADSVGVFQVESRAQMSMLPRLRPRTFYDLVVQVAIVRPGPIQGGMVHPYLARRMGREPIEYPNELVRGVLERTWGVPIFQEQVIKMAMVAAGFTGGEADQLRRAMASWKLSGKLAPFEEKLKSGMVARHYDPAYADRLWQQILGFGEYGFPESHAASFALLVYVSAWLKCHHPAAFCCGLLNSLPMGFYSPSQLIQDAQRHGIAVYPARVEHSDWDHTLERRPDGALALRLGLRLVSGFNEGAAERIRAARHVMPFRTLQDLKERARLSRLELEALIAADALAALSGHRPQSQWEAAALAPPAPLLGALEREDDTHLHDDVQRPTPGVVAEVIGDYASLGLTLKAHPMQLLRAQKPFRHCARAAALPTLRDGQFVRIAGVVTGRQRPGTASGILFMTLEDETGNANVVVRVDVQQRCRQALLGSHIALVKGIVENRDGVVHVLAGAIEDVSAALVGLAPDSRDFH